MKWIIGIMMIVGISAATIVTQQRDYIRLSDSGMGVLVEGEGYRGNTSVKLVAKEGYKVQYLVEAIELMEEKGYEVVSVYGNSVGHFAVMRK